MPATTPTGIPNPNTPSASIQSHDAGMPSGFGTLPSISSRSPGSSMPRSAIAAIARPSSAATGRQRREGSRPSGNSSSGHVTSTSRPMKVQLSSHAAHWPSGCDRSAASTVTVASVHTDPSAPPPSRASPSRCPGRPASTSAPSAAQVASARPSPSRASKLVGLGVVARARRRSRPRSARPRRPRSTPRPGPRGAGGRAPAPWSARRTASPRSSPIQGSRCRTSCVLSESTVPRAPA